MPCLKLWSSSKSYTIQKQYKNGEIPPQPVTLPKIPPFDKDDDKINDQVPITKVSKPKTENGEIPTVEKTHQTDGILPPEEPDYDQIPPSEAVEPMADDFPPEESDLPEISRKSQDENSGNSSQDEKYVGNSIKPITRRAGIIPLRTIYDEDETVNTLEEIEKHPKDPE